MRSIKDFIFQKKITNMEIVTNFAVVKLGYHTYDRFIG